MGKALYRQYRSRSFDEVIGQDHITSTLKNSLEKKSISHAYLLTGPRGVGKTSVARILAHEANGLDYDSDSSHLDIIEIDAASNRRIDEVRALREKVHIAPTSAKYKVYIIDEVHMLTREAFNALLKTLEEPPEHVIFILATTEAHKLPETIISRCLRFTFKPIAPGAIAKHLNYIAKNEGLAISDAALDLLAIHGDGSFRDSISLLDQVKNISSKIELSDVERALGMAPQNLIDNILNSVQVNDPRALDEHLLAAYTAGTNEAVLVKQLADKLRMGLIENEPVIPRQDTVALLKALLDVPSSLKPKASLELALLDSFIFKETEKAIEKHFQPEIQNETHSVEQTTPDILVLNKEAAVEPINDLTPPPVSSKGADYELWQLVLEKLKERHSTIYSIARMAQADFFENTLTLSFQFPFHHKRMSEAKNKSALAKVVSDMGHNNIIIKVTLMVRPTDSFPSPKPSSGSNDPALSTINNIFGSGEMLES